MKRLVIATANRHKAGEMLTILKENLAGLDVEILTLADFPPYPEPDENGITYAENAEIKARAAAETLGQIAIADDAGLEIDALGGEPGLHSRRFAGLDTPFPVKMGIILERMRDMREERRGARFRCAVVVAEPGGSTHHVEATCEGRIAESPAGEDGFGYDPIFFLPEFGCRMAELAPEVKNRISHRAKTLALAEPILRRLL